MLTTFSHYLHFSFLPWLHRHLQDFIGFIYAKTHQKEILEEDKAFLARVRENVEIEIRYKEACHKITVLEQEQHDQLKVLQDEIEQLKSQLKKSVPLKQPLAKFREAWLSYHIDRIANNLYGCGLYYELWLERVTEAVDCFLDTNGSLLTDEEIRRLKQATDYPEDDNSNPDPELLIPFEKNITISIWDGSDF